MIIDVVANAQKYYSVHPLFKKAFEYVAGVDLAAATPGNYAVEGDTLRAIFAEQKGVTPAESTAEFECHNRHIDIQICIRGKEAFGWKPRSACTNEHGGYDEEKDVQLYNDSPDMFFELSEGQFVILFPEDVHAPMISGGIIKKLVIKIKI